MRLLYVSLGQEILGDCIENGVNLQFGHFGKQACFQSNYKKISIIV